MKVVINNCHGGFDLSSEAKGLCLSRGITEAQIAADEKEMRSDPILVGVVEELGERASDFGSELLVVEIPDGIDWQIENYDGWEWIAEAHRTWP